MEKKRDVCPVESEATASHVHGRRCTGIEQTNSLSSLCNGCKDKTTKRGFQHLYMSKTMTTSLWVHAAFIESVKRMTSGAPKYYMGRRRYYKKRKKIEALPVVSCSDTHSLERTLLQSTKVFFSGTTIPTLQTFIANSLNLSAVTDLKVVDSKDGARMELSNGDTVFTLIPRQDAIRGLTNVNNTLAALYALEKGKKSAETRGKKRIPVAEDNGKYITIGLKPARGRAGILESWPTNLSNDERNTITKLMTNCEEAAKGYIFSHELRGMEVARMLGGWIPQGYETSSQKIWGSLACGKNYYLNSHTDEDFFYSLTTTVSALGLREDIDRYAMDAPVCNYFTFAEQGVAVGMRPGDMLLFNPLYQHCLSSRTSMYESNDVFCLSLYLKTAIVGKNDNTLPLTDGEIKVLKEAGVIPHRPADC